MLYKSYFLKGKSTEYNFYNSNSILVKISFLKTYNFGNTFKLLTKHTIFYRQSQ